LFGNYRFYGVREEIGYMRKIFLLPLRFAPAQFLHNYFVGVSLAPSKSSTALPMHFQNNLNFL